MYYSLKNIKTKETQFCRVSEHYPKHSKPSKFYTGITFEQNKGWEIIGQHNTERQAIKNIV